MLATALLKQYYLEGPFLCCIRVNPYTLCGYVRLYADHPFQQRIEYDKEVRRLSPRITYAANDLDGEGWWLGIYRELVKPGGAVTPTPPTIFEMDGMRRDLQRLTADLRPRRYTAAEYAAWCGESLHALRERLPRTPHA